MKAVILAGGEGSRLRPLTCTVPKPLIPVVDRPVTDYIIDLLERNGITDIVFTLGYLSNEIIEYLESINNDKLNISYIVEKQPLGTAGSVKNAVDNNDEDILVVSGDCLTDINLSKVILYHKSINSDMTVVCSKVNDPREYGTVFIDKNGKIESFNEKPSWNFIDSDLVNTGIYIISKNVIDLIKENCFQDFAKDIFPLLQSKGLSIYGYYSSGYWCDMGEPESYRNSNEDILKGKLKQNFILNKNGIFGNSEKEYDCKIIPPVYFGDNIKIGKNAVIGPYAVIGDNTVIEEYSRIKKSILYKSVYIGKNCDIVGSVIADNCLIKDNVTLLEGSVIGEKCEINSNVKILNNVLIWPEKKISSNSTLNENYRYGKNDLELINEDYIHGYSYTELTVEKCTKIGSAFASLSHNGKLAIGYGNDLISKTSAMALLSGMISSGAYICDFGESYEAQLRFFIRFCKADGGIFVFQKGGITTVCLIGKNGNPLTSSQCRDFEKKFRTTDFIRSFDGKCIETDEIYSVSSLYESKLMTYCINGLSTNGFKIKSENEIINNVINRCISSFSYKEKNLPYFEIDYSGKNVYCKDESDNFISNDILLLICCQFAFEKGKDICVGYDAPMIIDELAEKYNCRVIRVAPSYNSYSDEISIITDTCPWSGDAVFTVFNILSIMKEKSKKIRELVNDLPVFNVQRRVIEFKAYPDKIRKLFPSAEKTDVGTVIKNSDGIIHISNSSNGRFIKITAEAKTAEVSEELCAQIENKIKSSSLDNNL